jgi:hypothetical protein
MAVIGALRHLWRHYIQRPFTAPWRDEAACAGIYGGDLGHGLAGVGAVEPNRTKRGTAGFPGSGSVRYFGLGAGRQPVSRRIQGCTGIDTEHLFRCTVVDCSLSGARVINKGLPVSQENLQFIHETAVCLTSSRCEARAGQPHTLPMALKRPGAVVIVGDMVCKPARRGHLYLRSTRLTPGIG